MYIFSTFTVHLSTLTATYTTILHPSLSPIIVPCTISARSAITLCLLISVWAFCPISLPVKILFAIPLDFHPLIIIIF